MGNYQLLALLSLAAVVTACAPAARQGSSSPGSAPSTASADDPRTLVYATRNEPVQLANRGLQPIPGAAAPTLFDAGLTRSAGAGIGTTELQLAEAFPQLGTDTWKVLPDGRMETTWRLRPNLKWHDGTPLTAEDFVFGFQVYSLPQFDGARLAGGLIDSVAAPDPRTMVFHWKRPSPNAGGRAEVQGDPASPPLPRHILASPFEQLDSEAFAALPYWSREFVGLGPYRLDRWEPGSFVEGVAFADYALGRPKIGRIQLIFVSDANTMVAKTLYGEIHFVDDRALEFEQALTLKRQWVATGDGALSYVATKIRYVQVQYKMEYTDPVAILDLRVRRALSHAIDKQAMVDTMLDGEPGMADTFLTPQAEYFGELDKILTKYPYDLRRTEQLMTEAGFTRDGSGAYVQGGVRFNPELAAFSGQGEREALILHDSWRRAGVEPKLRTISAVEQRDARLVSTYPAFRIEQTTAPAGVQHSTIGCATAERIWVGSNRGCFADPEYDRLWSTFSTGLDPAERRTAHIQAMQLLADKVAGMTLYYGYLINGYSSSLVGPTFGYNNIHEWYFK